MSTYISAAVCRSTRLHRCAQTSAAPAQCRVHQLCQSRNPHSCKLILLHICKRLHFLIDIVVSVCTWGRPFERLAAGQQQRVFGAFVCLSRQKVVGLLVTFAVPELTIAMPLKGCWRQGEEA